MARLGIFWLKEDSLADCDNTPPPGIVSLEIVEDLQAVLGSFKLIAGNLAADVIDWASRVNRMAA